MDTTQRISGRLLAAAAALALALTSLVVAVTPARAADANTISETVYFDSGKFALDDTAKATLDLFLLDVPADAINVSARVEGWVQRTRSKENDRRLSTARAKITAAYLETAGFAGTITAVGRGVKNASDAARRATVTITYSDPELVTPPAPGPTVPCKIPSAWVSTGASSITVGFILGCDGGSPITSVQYERDGNWITVSATSPFTMPEPVPGTTHSFSIRAVNAVGAGPVSYVFVTTGTCTAPELLDEGMGLAVHFVDGNFEYTVNPSSWSGNPTFTYQWYLGTYDEGTPINGATGQTLTTNGDSYGYVIVTGHVGSCSATAVRNFYGAA